MTLGNRIQEIRIQAGLSQEAFGEKIGVTRQTVSKWELDQVYPEIEKIVLISKIFKVTTDSLLIDGIDTFDVKYDSFVCGVYKSPPKKFKLLYLIVNIVIIIPLILSWILLDDLILKSIPICIFCLYNGLWSINKNYFSWFHRDNREYSVVWMWLILIICGIAILIFDIIYFML